LDTDLVAVVFNHPSAKHDVQTILVEMKFAAKVAKAAALKPFEVEEIAPGRPATPTRGCATSSAPMQISISLFGFRTDRCGRPRRL
jgi:hypothetical protein